MRELTLSGLVAMERPRNLGGIVNMAVSWSLAGGVAAGALISVLVITARLHSMGLITVAVIVAIFGSILGSVHGMLLGHIGREDASSHLKWRSWALVVAAAVAGGACAVPIAIWLALAAMAAAASESAGVVGLALGMPLALVIFAWATINGWHALELAYSRWPQKRLGTLLLLGAVGVLSLSALLLRGAVPGTEIQLSPLAALALIALAVLWVVSPAVILALRIAARPRDSR